MFIYSKNYVSLQSNMDIRMVKRKQSDIKKAAQKFVAEWKSRGKEDKDYVEFWEDLLEDVFGVPKARKEIEPQSKVKFEGTTKRIDIRVKTSKVIIEQKSRDVSLMQPHKVSDSLCAFLLTIFMLLKKTGYEEERRYNY